MILAVNIGNTYTSIGAFTDECRIEYPSQLPTCRTETNHGFAIKLRQLFELEGVREDKDKIDGAVISSVVPSLTSVVRDAIKLAFGVDAITVGAGVKTGLHIATDDPGTVGSDLVAISAAAKEEYPLPAIIVDMGTATTVTAVDENGRYIGGAILPGAKISLDALSEKASLLPNVDIAAPKKVISASTAECMRSGIIYGTAGAVDGVLDRFEEELQVKPKSIILTGEFAHVFKPHLRHGLIIDDLLVLKGLAHIYEKNKR